MIEKERIINELNIKSFETKNENNWNEQTILHITPWFTGIINFSLDKFDDNIFSHIKTIIKSMDSLDKTARKHLEENCETNEKKAFWDVISTVKRIEHNSLYLICVIFYSDFTFCLKYSVSNECNEKICPEYYKIVFNFSKDLTFESMFSEIYPIYIHFEFTGYPVIISLFYNNKSFKKSGIEGVIEEITLFNGKYLQSADDNSTEQNIYSQCPQHKSICITISLDKHHHHYNVYAKYAHKNVPINPENINSFICYQGLNFDDVGVLRTNNIYPIKWLKKHNQENPCNIAIPVKNKGNFYISCEIQNYEIKKMEIIEDPDICRKLEMGIYKEDKL